MADPPVVRLPPLAGRQHESWLALVEIAGRLGEHWSLVGGQMVFLYEVERDAAETRPTDDVDVVVDVRVEPAALSRIHLVLTRAGFDQAPPSRDGVAHRYRRGGATIDVLASDHRGRRAPLTLGIGRTIEAPGAGQALVRSGMVQVELADGASALVRRPTLVGALLGKVATTAIRSLSPSDRAKHRRDVDSLARLLGVDDQDGAELTGSERAALEAAAGSSELSPLGRRALVVLARSGGPTTT